MREGQKFADALAGIERHKLGLRHLWSVQWSRWVVGFHWEIGRVMHTSILQINLGPVALSFAWNPNVGKRIMSEGVEASDASAKMAGAAMSSGMAGMAIGMNMAATRARVAQKAMSANAAQCAKVMASAGSQLMSPHKTHPPQNRNTP